ncbi:uncharacterized protein [Musca autumnalis]|uniref:uncharacterized protein n=1 Tax=Musca autumnalis TaxID=221902 RepID=UPI003CF2B9C9
MFYSLETAGVDSAKTMMSKDDEKAMSILEKCTIQRADGHYVHYVQMPNSYDMALKRFTCLEKKLKNDCNLNDIFNKTISEYISKGYITKIANDRITSTKEKKVWYLPIFPVFNKDKPGKTRIVWDAAARAHGTSLNDMLMKGPDMLCSLPSILIRFREKAIAICGDIEQMFHQVFIREEDRNAQRFLWRGESDGEPDVYVMNVMIFGASCSPCISQYVKNINADKFISKYPTAAAAIKNNHYVDDYLDSVDTVEEAITLAQNVKYIHGMAGFNIRNWICNNKSVLAAMNDSNGRQQKSLNLGNEIEIEKVLGVFLEIIR